jgi:putative FmdB family regulatory protein
MPRYEYYCDNCRHEVAVTLSIGQHDNSVPACPQCSGKDLHPLRKEQAFAAPAGSATTLCAFRNSAATTEV